jgi:hypothetical protein
MFTSLRTPVMPVPAIAMSLNQVARACAGPCSDQCALPTTNHRAADSADTGADKRSFGSAVMRPAIAPGAPLRVDSQTAKSAEEKQQAKKYG